MKYRTKEENIVYWVKTCVIIIVAFLPLAGETHKGAVPVGLQNNQSSTAAGSFQHSEPDIATGLSTQQVEQRRAAGAVNTQPQGITPSVGRIVLKNVLTLFNFINIVLAVLLVLVGHPENILFLGIALCNTCMGIFQEVRAKRTLDKLSILAQNKVSVIRDSAPTQLDPGEIVLDDIVCLSSGNQICADAVVVDTAGLEVDESLLTGESDNIRKKPGDGVMSGSFVTAGQAYVRVTAVGGENYATALTVEAKQEKKPRSLLMKTLNNIIRALTIVIVPVGLLLFYNQYTSPEGTVESAMLGTSAAVLGMIPEGLILLTGVTLTVGAMNLAKRKALVQSLSSIETLARVDVLCLDKTGTITDGTLTFEELLPQEEGAEEQASQAIAALMVALRDENATATALRGAFPGGVATGTVATVPFSSSRKWSGASFAGRGSFLLGAPGFVFPDRQGDFFAVVEEYAAKGHRVLCLAHSPKTLSGEALPDELTCMALVVLSDTVRREAPSTFRYFAGQGVTLKVISGDDALTVSTVALSAGIQDADKYVDMSQQSDQADLRSLVRDNTVFGRVSPHQKRELIRALRANGHTTCMTGDGVNDVLAMKESDCSVAMIGGSDAARGASDFVLMSSDFSAMIGVLREGRRVINNIEMVSALYLVKTIYSAVLSLLYMFLPYPYPFIPLQMMPINGLTVGIPSFFLALRSNYQRPEGKFLANILEKSVPAALTVVFNILIVQLAGVVFDLPFGQTSTMNVLLTGVVGFVVLNRVSRPLTGKIKIMLVGLAGAFIVMFFGFGHLLMLENILNRNVFFYLPLIYTGPRMFRFLNRYVRKVEAWWARRKKRRALRIPSR